MEKKSSVNPPLIKNNMSPLREIRHTTSPVILLTKLCYILDIRSHNITHEALLTPTHSTTSFPNCHQQNVTPRPQSSWSNTQLHGPVVLLVHLDPPWSAISGGWLHKVDQVGSRWTRSEPGAPAGPWCWVVDQWCSGPLWST